TTSRIAVQTEHKQNVILVGNTCPGNIGDHLFLASLGHDNPISTLNEQLTHTLGQHPVDMRFRGAIKPLEPVTNLGGMAGIDADKGVLWASNRRSIRRQRSKCQNSNVRYKSK